MLRGRLGLETARIPYIDRHGLLFLSRGKLYVVDGTLHFATKGSPELEAGDYTIAFQTLSNILIGPGTNVTHDALRLLARHGTGLIAVGEKGVRFYASMPFGPDDSSLARRHVQVWIDEEKRNQVARRMYAWRMGEVFPNADISVLRGMEGARAKEMYKRTAEKYGIRWNRRRFDRKNPDSADLANQAINHAATAVQGAAMIAVASTRAIPQLGFIHEDSGISFCLDIADLFRDEITLPVAFGGVKEHLTRPDLSFEGIVRRRAGQTMKKKKVISNMIDKIKKLFDADDSSHNS